ncbi:MAG: Zeta toxin family protein [Nitrospinae bacterium]|nr:Zeta toxin family protein [Nitrospinota bacterium]
MAVTDEKRIFIIAGPNGAGKTTFATEFLPNEADCPLFINADIIAAELNPSEPHLVAFQAGRQMLEQIREHVLEGGHDVPETVIRRRFAAGWRNFEGIYRGLVDGWILYDNSGVVPEQLAEESRE